MNLNEDQHSRVPNEALLLKYITGKVCADEELAVTNWMNENEENKKIVTQLAYMYYAEKTQERINRRDPHKVFQKIKKRIYIKKTTFYLKRIAAVASFIIGIAGISVLFFQKEIMAPALVTVYSNDSSHADVTLPDGTMVHLNSRSSLTYPSFYSDDDRKVILTGEAYFKVARNVSKPFIVSIPNEDINIKVLGTEFNINAYKEDNIIQTTLISGSVELNTDGGKVQTILEPSQKAVYSSKDNQLSVKIVNTDRETDWMYNRLVFRETPMKDVLTRLSRFYNIEFDVKNQIIYNYTFTGIFEDKPLYQVLDYMKISSKIDYQITYKKDNKGTKSVVELRKLK